MKNTFLILIAAIFFAVLFASSGCKKTNNSTPAVDSARFYFHFHTNVDTNEVDDYGTTYTTSAGRKISVSKAQMFVSDIQLVKADGSLYSIPNVVLLKQMETEEYFVATVPAGSYKSVKFDVGLDAATNALASTADTALNHSDMWFGASAQPGGYVFVNFQGSIDTTTGATGTTAQMRPFMDMLGTNAHLTTITMPDHNPVYSFTKDQANFIHIIIDYNKLFTGVQLNNSANLMIMTATDNSSALSNTVSNNITGMFTYEE